MPSGSQARSALRWWNMLDLRHIAAALGGEVCGQQVLAPGPGHSPRDRSLAVRLSANAAGFICHSHAGDNWQICVEHVRARLGLPPWKLGDEQDRRIEPSLVKTFDRATVDREADYRSRNEDDLLRITGCFRPEAARTAISRMDTVEVLEADEGLLTLSLANASEKLPAIRLRWRSTRGGRLLDVSSRRVSLL